MFKWFEQLFSNPQPTLRVTSRCDRRPALHVAFLENLPCEARGALLTTENPELLLEQMRAASGACAGLHLWIHGVENAPLSPRALGVWLYAIARDGGVSEVRLVLENTRMIRDALETARRRGCAIEGL